MSGELDREYEAQWIWAKVETKEPFQFVRFRKSFALDSVPKSAMAYIAADTFYRLRINGSLVMHGPARSSAGHATVDPVNVRGFLKRGANVVTAEVLYCNSIDGHMFDALAQAPGFLFELEADGKCLIATDSSWEASEVTAWNRQSPRFSYQRGWVEDWNRRAEAEEAWQPVVVLGQAGIEPWKTVEMRDIPLPAPFRELRPSSVVGVQRSATSSDQPKDWIERLEKEPLQLDSSAVDRAENVMSKHLVDTVLHGDGAQVTYDFGENEVGFIGFEVTGKAGQVLEFAWNERLSDRDSTVRPLERLASNNVLRYVLRDGRQAFLSFNPQTMRYLRVVLRSDGDVVLHRLSITEFRFAAPTMGDFVCSDKGLNLIFQAARRTAMLNTLDTFMDCPSRERGAWLHDSYWTAQAVYTMFGDRSINRRMVRQVAESQGYLDPPGMVQALYPANWTRDRFIPGHALFWVLQAGLENRWTGETESARQALPAVRRLMDTFEGWRNSDGLLENVPSWNFIDWADVRTDGVCIALNAMYAMALDECARMVAVVGDRDQASAYERDAAQVRAAINSLCGGELFYPDALVRDEQKKLVPSKECSETTQYDAMWGGIASEERMRRMWKAMRDDFIPNPDKKVQPIQGLTRGGMYSFPERLKVAVHLGDYPALIRDIRAMFLPMAESAPGTLWEQPWPISSLCHGFAAMPATFLMEDVLGIRLDRPLTVAPHSGGVLSSCKGYVTTAQGRVEAAWRISKKRYELKVSIPKGTSADVILPEEAKAIWQSAPSPTPWPKIIKVKGRTRIIVEPGKIGRMEERAKGREGEWEGGRKSLTSNIQHRTSNVQMGSDQ